jgi:malonyl-CoA decarboxylase
MAIASRPAVLTTKSTRSWLDRLWASLADRSRARASGDIASPLDQAKTLAEALLSERGEASGAALSRELIGRWRALSDADRAAFHRFIADGFAPDPDRLRAAARAYLEAPTNEAAARLADAADPVRQELLRRMNMAPGGTAALVAMRQDVLDRLQGEPRLKPLDSDLRHLFASWFNHGFLELKRIDWQSSAAVLEKLVQYEAVHEIQGWDDLRRRVAPDRRIFGFFHPALPGEPLIFVEVALVHGLAAGVQTLLAKDEDVAAAAERAREADTAIFYSISNCQRGLRGVSFGNFLIKQVVEELKAELPQLTQFATLSPMPGFRRWVEKRLEARGAGALHTTPAEYQALAKAARASIGTEDSGVLLRTVLADERWWEDAGKADAVRGPLTRLAALYLTTSNAPKGPLDPVARFHLGNGARLERINWLGNRAPRGVRESYGLMVNYRYDPATIEANHEALARDGTIVRSPEVDALLTTAENGSIPLRPRWRRH